MKSSGESIKVLIADDHPMVRAGLRATIAEADGIELVGEASNGAEAASLSLSLVPDVMLFDMRMPDGGGLGAIEQVVAQRPDARIIVLTSFETEDEVKKAIDAGASGYILKNSGGVDISAAIRAVYEGGMPLDPRVASKLLSRSAGRRGQTLPISTRQREILGLISRGSSNAQIAGHLHLAEATVKAHLTNIFRILGVSDRTQAVVIAARLGFIEL